MFSPAERERIRERLVEKARNDSRLVAAAAVGSTATGGDRWSDLDLTFALAPESAVAEVLEEWTRDVVAEFGAAELFDLPAGSTIYRVFLFPGVLQVDLSFGPAGEWGARGPRFQLLFGEVTGRPAWGAPPSPQYTLGFAIHHVVRANVCIERGQLWQAEYWQHQARDAALTLACHRHGLDVNYGRGFDSLPPEELTELSGALVQALTVNELRRALAVATRALLRESDGVSDAAERLRSILAEICDPPTN